MPRVSAPQNVTDPNLSRQKKAQEALMNPREPINFPKSYTESPKLSTLGDFKVWRSNGFKPEVWGDALCISGIPRHTKGLVRLGALRLYSWLKDS